MTVYRNKYAEKPEPDLLAATQEIAQSYDMELLDPITVTKCVVYVHQNGSVITSTHETKQINRTLEYRLLDELNAELGSSYTLSDQEVLVCHTKDFTEGMTLQIDGSNFTVVTLPESDALNTYLTQTGASSNPIFFFRDKDTLMRARQMDESATLSYVLWFDYDIEAVNAGLFQQNLYDHLSRSEGNFGTRFKSEARTDFYSMYGSLLFVGLFFVALFLITTVLIIYYKQITEGYEDRQRFRIMRQVGLSDAEVRTSIRRQVQMVFFLPIIVALVHIAFAFPALQKIMTLFEMHNTPLFIGCVAVSALVFLGFYTGVYLITARTYYHIVTSAPQS